MNLIVKNRYLYKGIINFSFFVMLYYMSGIIGMGIFFAGYLFSKLLYQLLIGNIENTVCNLFLAKSYRDAVHGFRIGILYIVIVCSLLFAGSIFVAGPVLDYIAGYRLTRYIFPAFSLYLSIKGITCCFKGFHKGMENIFFVVIGDFLYGPLLLGTGFFFIKRGLLYGEKVARLCNNPLIKNLYGIYSSIAALVLTEIIIMIILAATMFFVGEPRRQISANENKAGGFFSFFLSDLISGISESIFVLLAMFIIYPLLAFGLKEQPQDRIYSSLGIVSFSLLIPISIPVFFVFNFIKKEIGRMRKCFLSEDYRGLRKRFVYLFKNIIYLLLPISFSYLIMGKALMALFGISVELGGNLLPKGSFLVIIISLYICFNRLIVAINHKLLSMICTAAGIASIALFAMKYIKQPTISGIVPLLIVGFSVAAVFSLIAVYITMSFNITECFKRVVVCFAGAVALILIELLAVKLVKMNAAAIVITYIISFVAYLFAVTFLKGNSTRDIKSLKGTFTYYPTKYLCELFFERY